MQPSADGLRSFGLHHCHQIHRSVHTQCSHTRDLLLFSTKSFDVILTFHTSLVFCACYACVFVGLSSELCMVSCGADKSIYFRSAEKVRMKCLPSRFVLL